MITLTEPQLRAIVLQTSVAYSKALFLGRSTQEAELIRTQVLYDEIGKLQA